MNFHCRPTNRCNLRRAGAGVRPPPRGGPRKPLCEFLCRLGVSDDALRVCDMTWYAVCVASCPGFVSQFVPWIWEWAKCRNTLLGSNPALWIILVFASWGRFPERGVHRTLGAPVPWDGPQKKGAAHGPRHPSCSIQPSRVWVFIWLFDSYWQVCWFFIWEILGWERRWFLGKCCPLSSGPSLSCATGQFISASCLLGFLSLISPALSLCKRQSSGVTGHFTQHTHLNREHFLLFLPLCAHGRLCCFLFRWYMPLRCCFGSGFCDLRGLPLETPFFIYLGTTLISEATGFFWERSCGWGSSSFSDSSPFVFSSFCSVIFVLLCGYTFHTRKARRRARRKDGLGRSTSALGRVRLGEPLWGPWVWTPTVRVAPDF